MNNRFLLVSMLFISQLVSAQLTTIVGQNFVNLNELDWKTSNENLNDCFRRILSNHNILLLAETDHGHGSAMDAQAKILKGLIDSGKISTLFIESSRINCDYINSLLKAEGHAAIKESEKYFHTSEFLYWKKIGFWNFLSDAIIQGKLTLKGIDINGISPVIMKELYEEALNLNCVKNLRTSDSVIMQEIDFQLGNAFAGWQTASPYYMDGYILLKKFVVMVCEEYAQLGNLNRVSQWKSVSKFFYWMARRGEPLKNNYYVNQIETTKQNTAFNAVRDSFMAVNIFEQYTGKDKVAISLSAYHALRNSNSIEGFQKCCMDSTTKLSENSLMRNMGKLFIVYASQLHQVAMV